MRRLTRKLSPLLTAVLFLMGGLELSGQDLNLKEAFQRLLEKALQLNIEAKILPPNAAPVWNMKSRELTIPGRSVAVKLVGDNIRIEAVFTPYQQEDGQLLLVAQGQVWLSESSLKETRYMSTFNSIPIVLGEKILFFPLGIGNISKQQTFTLQLEVEVLPYKSPAEESSN